ncbi:MAG: hypothetical protein ACOX69_05895 [Coriobacteriales bacterium]
MDDKSAAKITLNNTWLADPAQEHQFCSHIDSRMSSDPQLIERMLFAPSQNQTLHLIVSSEQHRLMRNSIEYRVHKTPLPNRSFVRFGKVWVACPELWLSELALKFSPIAYLKLLGMAFGGFTPDPTCEMGLVQRNFPLTSPKAMENFLASAENIPGAKAARRFLGFAPAGSESPQEVNLFLRLTLPLRWGGRAIPTPCVNPAFRLDTKTRLALKKSTLRLDMYWPEQRLCVEYDGKLHSDPNRVCKDAARRNFLLSRGISMITVTNEQMKDPRQFEELVRTICKVTGTRYYSPA